MGGDATRAAQLVHLGRPYGRAYTRSLGISAAHLTRLCRQHLGATAKQVIEARLEVLARRELLYGDRSAAQVAASLGFRDPSYFARFFRRRVGVSPAKYRVLAG